MVMNLLKRIFLGRYESPEETEKRLDVVAMQNQFKKMTDQSSFAGYVLESVQYWLTEPQYEELAYGNKLTLQLAKVIDMRRIDSFSRDDLADINRILDTIGTTNGMFLKIFKESIMTSYYPTEEYLISIKTEFDDFGGGDDRKQPNPGNRTMAVPIEEKWEETEFIGRTI